MACINPPEDIHPGTNPATPTRAQETAGDPIEAAQAALLDAMKHEHIWAYKKEDGSLHVLVDPEKEFVATPENVKTAKVSGKDLRATPDETRDREGYQGIVQSLWGAKEYIHYYNVAIEGEGKEAVLVIDPRNARAGGVPGGINRADRRFQ